MLKETLTSLFEKSIIQNWELEAFSDYESDTITYSHVADRIMFLHELFRNYNVKAGNKIAIIGKNSSNWAITYLATVSFGAVIVPILPDFKPDDVHHIVNHSDSVLLFSSDQIFDDLDESVMTNLLGVLSIKDFSILYSDKKSVKEIIKTLEKSYLDNFDSELTKQNFHLKTIKNDKLAVIVYTSGTTGFSKGVMLSHNSLVANIQFAQVHMPLDKGDTIVSFLPIAHVFGCAFEFLFPFCSGCHITFLGKTPSPKVILKAFGEVHPRLILSVPLVIEKIYKKQIKPILNKNTIKLLLQIPMTRKLLYKKINAKLTTVFGSDFREIVIGGAPLNAEVEQFLHDIGFRFTIGYGMSECGPLISYTGWKNYRLQSTGQIVDTMKVKIDSADQYNDIGEIMVRGDNVMNGYYKNPEATKKVLDKDGWLRTGDLGVIDKDNFIYIKGRSKSMILGSSGKNIYPEELEAKLNNLSFVQESLVVEKNGQLVALVYPDMELIDKNNISESALEEIMEKNKQEMNDTFPSYMRITKIEIYPEEFEKTPKKSIKRFLYS
ncbi:MAG: AMP-binding protein [Candidatus Cloacimonetes bacterium]|nr:AMP-binding protein [Candidatus Cloacimonadota bacterium]